MKKFYLLFYMSILSFIASARVTVTCDVVYMDNEITGTWSDFYRTKVDILTGSELGKIGDGIWLYAVIWFSQTQCAVIKLNTNHFSILDYDLYSAFSLFNYDVSNRGIEGFQDNDRGNKRKWRIFGKDENSQFIDSRFYKYADSRPIIKREPPEPEPKYPGDFGEVLLITPNNILVAYANEKYWVMERVDYYMYKLDVHDIIVADFSLYSGSQIIANATKDYSGIRVRIMEVFEDSESCNRWLNNYIKP